jgi:predicted nucleic-acid-binding protein
MRIIADTNVLLRFVLRDDEEQFKLAKDALETADSVAVSVHALCELAWVLERKLAAKKPDIATAIRYVLETRNVVLNRQAAEKGLAMLDAGGDFADGVIAFDGQWLGGEAFVSFDRKAVMLLRERGEEVVLLGS